MILELTPAYGRDYRSAREVLSAWVSGADFLAFDPTVGRDRPINRPQLEELGLPTGAIVYCNLRYSQLRRLKVVRYVVGK